VSDDQIKHMVNRFLSWRLPEPFHPDAGVSFKPSFPDEPMRSRHWPVGTNLFNADQAEAMVRHMLDSLPQVSAQEDDELIASLTGFTPGPWKLEEWQNGALYVGFGRVGRDGIDGIIADWPDAGDYGAEGQAVRKANARLIAEAPTLLARLTAMREEIERKDEALRNIAEGNLGDAPWQGNYERIRKMALAARTDHKGTAP
jgi:hypothetical protein